MPICLKSGADLSRCRSVSVLICLRKCRFVLVPICLGSSIRLTLTLSWSTSININFPTDLPSQFRHKSLWQATPNQVFFYSVRTQYLDVLSGEIEKNLYRICIIIIYIKFWFFYIYNIQILYRFFSISPDKTSRYCGQNKENQYVTCAKVLDGQ
jgi:hypothetical protein